MRARRLREFGVSEDGRSIKLTFEMDAGTDITVELGTDAAGGATMDLASALNMAAQRSNLAMQGLVSAAGPSRFRVGLAEGEDTVLLGFQMPNGLEHHFSLPIEFADRLRRQMNDIFEREIPSRRPETRQ